MFLHVQCQEYLQDGENWVTRNYDECLAWILSEAHLKGLCQLESMRSEVMQITFNCQNSIVFNA